MRDPRVEVLERYIRTNLLSGPTRALDDGTALVSEGVVDSMGLVLLASFVEEQFGVRIDDADIRAGGLETITDVLALVDRVNQLFIGRSGFAPILAEALARRGLLGRSRDSRPPAP